MNKWTPRYVQEFSWDWNYPGLSSGSQGLGSQGCLAMEMTWEQSLIYIQLNSEKLGRWTRIMPFLKNCFQMPKNCIKIDGEILSSFLSVFFCRFVNSFSCILFLGKFHATVGDQWVPSVCVDNAGKPAIEFFIPQEYCFLLGFSPLSDSLNNVHWVAFLLLLLCWVSNSFGFIPVIFTA